MVHKRQCRLRTSLYCYLILEDFVFHHLLFQTLYFNIHATQKIFAFLLTSQRPRCWVSTNPISLVPSSLLPHVLYLTSARVSAFQVIKKRVHPSPHAHVPFLLLDKPMLTGKTSEIKLLHNKQKTNYALVRS